MMVCKIDTTTGGHFHVMLIKTGHDNCGMALHSRISSK